MLRGLVGTRRKSFLWRVHKGLEKWKFPRGKRKMGEGEEACKRGSLAWTKWRGQMKWQLRVGLPQVHLWDQPRLGCPGTLPGSGDEQWWGAGACWASLGGEEADSPLLRPKSSSGGCPPRAAVCPHKLSLPHMGEQAGRNCLQALWGASAGPRGCGREPWCRAAAHQDEHGDSAQRGRGIPVLGGMQPPPGMSLSSLS